jgi:hypothetical protein
MSIPRIHLRLGCSLSCVALRAEHRKDLREEDGQFQRSTTYINRMPPHRNVDRAKDRPLPALPSANQMDHYTPNQKSNRHTPHQHSLRNPQKIAKNLVRGIV